MSAISSPTGARRRLLETAAELFYRDGVNAVGVDRISAEAGVSKRTLYQQFGDKAGLVAAALEDKGPEILGIYIPAEDVDATPRDRILAVFDALESWSGSPMFRGCPFVNVATELSDPAHPARGVARKYKMRLKGYLERQAHSGGAADPQALAEQLLMVFDGAIVLASINHAPIPRTARDAAGALLDSHGVVRGLPASNAGSVPGPPSV